MGLFDERNLLEISSPDFPGERLVACRNPELAKLRRHTRAALLAATQESLQKIQARVEAGKLVGADKIGAVSYTHLDVYKRQACTSAGRVTSSLSTAPST